MYVHKLEHWNEWFSKENDATLAHTQSVYFFLLNVEELQISR